jgi:hypothetical protein
MDGRIGRTVDDHDRLRALVRPAGAPADLRAVLHRVSRVAVDELGLQGAAVSLLPSPGSHVVASASDASARALEGLQFDSGDGPSGDAYRASAPVLVADLAARAGRWPGFAEAAAASGVGAVFAFPLHVGAARFGALTLYRSEPGGMSKSELGCALTLVDLAVEALIDGSLPARDGDVGTAMDQGLDGHAQVYQAQGMVMVQLGVSLPEALARMRAHAYAHDMTLVVLATEIVEGRTRLTKE